MWRFKKSKVTIINKPSVPPGEFRVMRPTNADHIRAMSDEEMAVTLMCPNEMGMADIPCDHSDDKNCCECLLRWLSQPAEED